jgi:hypothetical protein
VKELSSVPILQKTEVWGMGKYFSKPSGNFKNLILGLLVIECNNVLINVIALNNYSDPTL